MREENDTLVTDWIFVEDVMQIFKISKRTVYRWKDEGVLPYSKPTGGKLLFSRAIVDNLIHSRMTINTRRSSA
tara:strand:- start:235 stop:453 length:219 start_codon:yes stop_codon:yes gene_type:complete